MVELRDAVDISIDSLYEMSAVVVFFKKRVNRTRPQHLSLCRHH